MASGLGSSDITAVIPTNGKRKNELEEIELHLKSVGFKDIVFAKGKDGVLHRYTEAAKVKTDYIYTQDDDCIITDIPDLIGLYEPGKIITNMKTGHLNTYSEATGGKVALVGWGCIFHKDALKNLKKYTDKFPEDDLYRREADRVFTWVNEKRLVIADGHIKDFPSAWGGMSYEEDHFPSMMRMVKRLKTL